MVSILIIKKAISIVFFVRTEPRLIKKLRLLFSWVRCKNPNFNNEYDLLKFLDCVQILGFSIYIAKLKSGQGKENKPIYISKPWGLYKPRVSKYCSPMAGIYHLKPWIHPGIKQIAY